MNLPCLPSVFLLYRLSFFHWVHNIFGYQGCGRVLRLSRTPIYRKIRAQLFAKFCFLTDAWKAVSNTFQWLFSGELQHESLQWSFKRLQSYLKNFQYEKFLSFFPSKRKASLWCLKIKIKDIDFKQSPELSQVKVF